MKIYLLSLFLLFSSTVFAENSFLKNKTIVGCENEEGYPPFIYRNKTSGELEGYSVDILNLVFKGSGAQVNYRLLPWKRCMSYMSEGKLIDIVLAAASTKERRERYLFSNSFSKVHLAYFYDRERYPEGLNIRKPSDFNRFYEVCGMLGFVYGGYGLSREVKKSGRGFQQLIRRVVHKRCDTILVRYEVFKNLPKLYSNIEFFDRMKGEIIPWRKDNPINFYFLARKDSAYHKHLLDFINKRMKQMKKTGELKIIKEKYGLFSD
ncbi:hypothetical protein A9Q84_14015 [Halobacteriovorax marinus]|uniref:Solute-binding protein family 3/N-terminal domain-containing protein n=1 Tax=Halobacteriovorax marinus TaxID=97084 RepID=A0A1Y5F911_9BACT|nr:hypothetical protein A9Q84_14015 [Halobacteriovorax marinus]